MMKTRQNRVHALSKYSFSKGERLLLDTNVWIYVHPEFPARQPDPLIRAYSEGIKSMQAAQAELITNVTILGEYLNRFCNLQWNMQYKGQYPKYKNFRNSSDFAAVAQTAIKSIRQILRLCTWSEDTIGAKVIDSVLTTFMSGDADFSDLLLIELCRENGWKIVTNDGDFRHGRVEIITANRSLLRNLDDVTKDSK